jgi:hypothetical protein
MIVISHWLFCTSLYTLFGQLQLKRTRGANVMEHSSRRLGGAATSGDRRQATRYSFSATAEVLEIASGTRVSARAADLSKNGCYLDTLNPFSVGSKVQLCIRWNRVELACSAVVRDSKTGMGMGVAFTDLDDTQKALLESWIEKIASPAPGDSSSSPHSENIEFPPPSEERDALAVRLIEVLHKKGLLDSSDIASLLHKGVL